MKKTEQVIVPFQSERIIYKEVYTCDFCGYKTDGTGWSKGMRICTICERHVCSKWEKPCFRLDPHHDGDYLDPYCPVCYNLRFEKYSKEIEDIEEKAYNEKDAIIERIKKESLNQK